MNPPPLTPTAGAGRPRRAPDDAELSGCAYTLYQLASQEQIEELVNVAVGWNLAFGPPGIANLCALLTMGILEGTPADQRSRGGVPQLHKINAAPDSVGRARNLLAVKLAEAGRPVPTLREANDALVSGQQATANAQSIIDLMAPPAAGPAFTAAPAGNPADPGRDVALRIATASEADGINLVLRLAMALGALTWSS
ncbi:hypothetical protein ACFC1T_09345 [Kitasatospora sp. NPDC056076]|uniref:hypothetical protein n=1 Tax=Kitasatospora sp. NPDC056076 TaxID=3345703 RepID=UPI0035DDB6A1